MFSNANGYKDDIQPLGGFDFDGAIAFGAEAGGPIKKDQLWYFAGIDAVQSDRETLAAGEIADQNFTRRSLLGKISLTTGGHVLTASAHTSGLDRDGEGAGPLRAPEALWNDNGRTTMVKVEDSATLGSRWFVTALAAFTDAGFTADPAGTAATHLDAADVFRDGFQRVTADRTSKEAACRPHRLLRRARMAGRSGIPVGQRGYGVRMARRRDHRGVGYAGDVDDSSRRSRCLRVGRLHVGVRPGHRHAWTPDRESGSPVRRPARPQQDVGDDRERRLRDRACRDVRRRRPRLELDERRPAARRDVRARTQIRRCCVRAAFSRYPDQLGIDRILLGNPIAPIAGHELDGSETFLFFDANGNRQLDPGETRTASSVIRFATDDPRFLEPPSLVADDLDPPMTNELLSRRRSARRAAARSARTSSGARERASSTTSRWSSIRARGCGGRSWPRISARDRSCR